MAIHQLTLPPTPLIYQQSYLAEDASWAVGWVKSTIIQSVNHNLSQSAMIPCEGSVQGIGVAQGESIKRQSINQ